MTLARAARAAVAAVLAVCFLTPRAFCQGAVRADPQELPRLLVGFDGRQLSIRDTATNRVIMGQSIAPPTNGAGVTPTIRATVVANGADLEFTYRNTTDAPVPLGRIVLDGIRLPRDCRQYTFSQDTSTRVLPGYGFSSTWYYPRDTYSPVQVLASATHTLGISLQYPAAEYDHAAGIALVGIPTLTATGGPPHWSHQFRFEGVMIPAQTTRIYTVSVRVALEHESFLTTLLPYRDYFRATYGPVAYPRDGRPISGEAVASLSSLSPENPRGYRDHPARPDLFGWSAWVDSVLPAPARGYQRVMLWAPSGAMPLETGLNYTWRFMTPINDFPIARDTFSQFTRVGAAGIDLGFWWGNCMTLMRGWDNPTAEALDIDNPEHRALAFAELDMAVGAGARMIGLDAYRHQSPEAMRRWLPALAQRAPGVRFITENAAPDLVHNLAPTFHEAAGVTGRHLLADFLNPGHETWAAISSTPESRAANRVATVEETQREARRVESLGFVPLIYGRVQAPTPGPAIHSVPRETIVGHGAVARLEIVVGGSAGPVTYQWQKDGHPLVDGPNPVGTMVAGSGSPTLSIQGAGLADIGVYSVVAVDALGQSSAPAVAVLIGDDRCAADFNADGNVDPDDLADFITCFFLQGAPCTQADFNIDGRVDPDDLADFITAFFNDCR